MTFTNIAGRHLAKMFNFPKVDTRKKIKDVALKIITKDAVDNDHQYRLKKYKKIPTNYIPKICFI